MKASIEESQPSDGVQTRRVHYFSGFDPRGARFYHRLYREESAKQATHFGTHLEIGSRKSAGSHRSSWSIEGRWENQAVRTDYQFMAWDDIVREHWDSKVGQLFRRSIPVYLKYVMAGGFNRVREASKGAFLTSVFPMTFLITLLLLALVGGTGVGAGLQLWIGHLGLSLAAALSLAAGLLFFGLRFGEKLGALWILRTCVFVVTWGTQVLPGLRRRIEEMARHILTEQEERPVDEVLIVGHSIGTILAVSVVAEILRKSDQELPGITLLTLGQCIPYVSVMPTAIKLREDLGVLATDPRIPWFDVTAPPDPLCFFEVDPITISGIDSDIENRPKRLVLRIFKMFSDVAYSRIRRNKLRLHFQYLMASELSVGYDYFRITAGPDRLARALALLPLATNFR